MRPQHSIRMRVASELFFCSYLLDTTDGGDSVLHDLIKVMLSMRLAFSPAIIRGSCKHVVFLVFVGMALITRDAKNTKPKRSLLTRNVYFKPTSYFILFTKFYYFRSLN